METALANDDEIRISPEALTVADTYLMTLDIDSTAKQLDIPREEVVYYLNKKPVKNYVDTIFLEQGYLNRHKIQDTLSTIIAKKLEELEDSELTSSKDIADLLKLAHDIRIKEMDMMLKTNEKKKATDTQINVQQNNYGTNYMDLIEKIVRGPEDGNK